jgi:lipoprotein-anchoring transpeptidase ErfK/SrfK
MEPNQVAAFELIEQAQQAMKKGELNTARQLAARAAQSAPELEEVWLIMAALASPRGSVAFIQKALDINPQSERAQKGMLWARKRYQDELAKQAAAAEAPTTPPVQELPPVILSPEPTKVTFQEEEKPVEAAPELAATIPHIEKRVDEVPAPIAETPAEEKTAPNVISAISEPKTSPRKPIPEAEPSVPLQDIEAEKTVTDRQHSNLLIPLLAVGILVLISVIFIALLSFTPAAALINGSVFNGQAHGPAWAQVIVAKASSGQAAPEPVVVPTATVLDTAVPEMLIPSAATATNTPLLTPTQPQPTNSPIPTEISPTLTATPLPLPTATLYSAALPTSTVEVASAGGEASPTPLPTDTAMPASTPYVAPTARASNGGNNTTTGASSGHWIDVDLTHQMVYAFDGNTVVNSFLVSTGTWQHPTVTGQYHVYVKYRSTTMTGPGYSLPNVPFTMYFYKGYGLHGTYWHSNFGTPMSHGCVNLSIPDSEWLYNWSSVGTLVNIHY